MKLSQLVDIVMGNTLRKCFEWFGGLGPSDRFLIFHHFEGVEWAD